jgi:hypothetical protein
VKAKTYTGSPPRRSAQLEKLGFEGATLVRRMRGEVRTEQYSVVNNLGQIVETGKRQRVTHALLSRYCRRGEISKAQFLAGERLAADAAHTEVSVKSLLNFEDRGGGDMHTAILKSGDQAAICRQRYDKAITAMGEELAPVVVYVAVLGGLPGDWAKAAKLPEKDGIARLRAGLQVLVRHYPIA